MDEEEKLWKRLFFLDGGTTEERKKERKKERKNCEGYWKVADKHILSIRFKTEGLNV
jgi:hypothetical protein